MGRSHSSFRLPIWSSDTLIHTHDGKRFKLSTKDVVDHIVLLERVIEHPEMTQKGKILDNFIEDYCKRMARQEIGRKRQQSKLPWQIDWIWHVHRLHPVAYNNDCVQQLPGGELVDKTHTWKHLGKDRKYRPVVSSEPVQAHSTFVPSIDLASAVLRQCDFLEKFKQYCRKWRILYIHQDSIERMIQNYISFMKLANENELIVPTFEIDLIWHTHMRYPSRYQIFSKALCGFLLDHNDSIESDILENAYQQTADRWKATYNIDYEDNIDRDNLLTSQYISSCAIITSIIRRNTSSDGYEGRGYDRYEPGGACGGGG